VAAGTSAVYTQGQAGRPEHLIAETAIPVVPSTAAARSPITARGSWCLRAGRLRRRGYGIRELVTRMEQAVIDLLAAHGVVAERRAGAPGSMSTARNRRARAARQHGCTYHGLAFNVDMDLGPFAAINPCGYAGMRVTQCRDLG